ncbi:hypothetical protein Syun_010726 [Stephania yunnanensis]|uniref:Uncharacterized protein n=1 Tax=Stephania yunnanensis TaxID=152371 RepID=A0AAP0KJC6_9MAGN
MAAMMSIQLHNNLQKKLDPVLQNFAFHKQADLLHNGVFLDQNKMKVQVDKCTGYVSVMLYARNLSITWGDDKRYWTWTFMPEPNHPGSLIEVAELLSVCWLEAKGEFDASLLMSGLTYEVVFTVKLKCDGYGWDDHPVTLKLEEGNRITECKEKLNNKPKDQWIELNAGTFLNCGCETGMVKFSLFETVGGQWKKGLVIKGVTIRPKIPN